jgi:hypothetical protein
MSIPKFLIFSRDCSVRATFASRIYDILGHDYAALMTFRGEECLQSDILEKNEEIVIDKILGISSEEGEIEPVRIMGIVSSDDLTGETVMMNKVALLELSLEAGRA